jgi:copper resistance protein D
MLAALAICRTAHYGAAMLLFGGGVFVCALAPERLAVAPNKPAWRIALATALVLVLTSLCWLALEAGAMGGDWSDALRAEAIGAVMFDTDFGRAWRLHVLLVVCLLAATALQRIALTLSSSTLALASLAGIGHAAMQTGAIGWLHRANLAVHLLSAGFWLGALPPLLIAIRRFDDPALRDDALIVLRRFSIIGQGAVALVIVTGVGNALLILGVDLARPIPLYVWLLAAKVALVGAMIGLALINRYGLAPKLRAQPDAARALMRNSLAELALGIFVVALVSVFGLLDPYG